MSARLGFNETPYTPWKGKTFVQVTSFYKNNKWIHKTMDKQLFFRAPPLKLYRREIASTYDSSQCNVRTSSSIDLLYQPNGSLIYADKPNIAIKGLTGTLDINYPNNTTERLGACNNPYTCNEANARARVRSSGMIKRKFNPERNNDTYYTDAKQYLISRNKTFQQNQYNYIRVGDPTLKPGDTQSVSNIYSPQGLNHCSKYYINHDTSFGYQWLDASYYQVDVSAGYYSVDDVNTVLKNRLTANEHYFINNNGNYKVFLLNITYNTYYNKVELQSFPSGRTLYPTTTFGEYSVVNDVSNQLWANGPYTDLSIDTSGVPVFVIPNNSFQYAVGFSAGNYPAQTIGHGQTLANQSSLSSFPPGIQPTYVPIYYKPNNTQFAQQGGVSSGSHITRLRYNTITNNTAAYRKTYGTAVANSLAYGVPEYGYTLKDRIGYPNKCSPTFSKSDSQENCTVNSIVHEI